MTEKRLLTEAIEQDQGQPLSTSEVIALLVLAVAVGVWGLLAATTAWLWRDHGLTWGVVAAGGFVIAGGAALVVGAARAIEGRRAWREARAFAPPGTSPPAPKAHDPILVKALTPKRLEAPHALTSDVVILLLRELWDHGKLSRREVMGLRLPGGGRVSRAMWEKIVGGYRDSIGREMPGLLAAAGLIQRTNAGSWQWRDGLTLEAVMGCFDFGDPQIESPKAAQDVGGAGWAGDAQENPPMTLGEQRRQRWVEVGCDVEQYLKGR